MCGLNHSGLLAFKIKENKVSRLARSARVLAGALCHMLVLKGQSPRSLEQQPPTIALAHTRNANSPPENAHRTDGRTTTHVISRIGGAREQRTQVVRTGWCPERDSRRGRMRSPRCSSLGGAHLTYSHTRSAYLGCAAAAPNNKRL